MSIQNVNASISFDSDAASSGNAGVNIYKIVRRGICTSATRTLFFTSKRSTARQVTIEVADEVELGYQKLAQDAEEISVASQRRVNRGSTPGRLIAD